MKGISHEYKKQEEKISKTTSVNGLYPMMEMMTVIFMGLVMVVLSSKPEIRISNSFPKDLFFVQLDFF